MKIRLANLYRFGAIRVKEGHPEPSVSRVGDLEDFMLFVGSGMKGKKGDDYYFNHPSVNESEDEKEELKASYQSFRNGWNNFCGLCKRMGHPVIIIIYSRVASRSNCV